MLKKLIKKNKFLYKNCKKIQTHLININRFKCNYKFQNRSKNEKCLCIVLSGYKTFLMDDVFERIIKFKKEKMDMCIITSGLYSEKIDQICKMNGWSYLSTKENNVSLVQNVAIKLHPSAKYIFKLDEDVFITKDYFERMLNAYKHAESSDYIPGVVAPLLNVNGYASKRILNKIGLNEEYKNRFEEPKYAAGISRQIENNYKASEFMWGKDGLIPQIDILNEKLWNEVHTELPCPIRFSIGAILFKRELWENMRYFKVNRKNNSMGADEEQLCNFCVLESRPIMVSENIVVGHFSFGSQTKGMKDFYKLNKDLFKINAV